MKYVSAMMTAASGKVRGIVASHNKGGQYFRGKTIPTNPRTAPQVATRSRLSSLIARFRAVLTAPQRAAWAVFAENTPKTDALGNTMLIHGPNWYVAANSIRMQGGFAQADDGPTIFALSTLSPMSATVGAGSTNLTMGWNAVDDWQQSTNLAGVNIYCSRPQNQTVNYFSGPYQYAGTIHSLASSGTAKLALPFPAASAGTNIFIRAVATSQDGRPSSIFRLKGISA